MWMSVLKRNFSNGRFPAARLFPSTNWNVRDSRFSGKPVVFFCRSGSRTQNKAELLERSASGKAYQLGGGILAWEQAGFPVWSIRELLPCFAQEPAFISGVLA